MFTAKKFLTNRALPNFLGLIGAGVGAAKGAPSGTAHLPGHRFTGMAVFETHTTPERSARWTPVRSLNHGLFHDTLAGCVLFKNRLTGSDSDILELSVPAVLSSGAINTVRIVDGLADVYCENKTGAATNARNGWSLLADEKSRVVEAVFHTLAALSKGKEEQCNRFHLGLPIAA